MAFRTLAILFAAACALTGATAQAERLAVEGVYAARTDGALGVTDIAIEPFEGRDGFALENALASELASAHIYGEPYFRLSQEFIEDEENLSRGEAVLRGFAHTRVHDSPDGVLEHTRCVRKELVGEGEHAKKKCVESITDIYDCRRLHVEFSPEIALITDGKALYNRQDNFAQSERYCADSSYIPSAEAMLNPMISRVARLVRLDLAPEQRFNRFRIFESRKGLAKADRKVFKRAIKLTKSDPSGACLAFEDILGRNPFQRSALYNVALCREAEGQLALAADAYEHLIRISDKSQFRNGRARVESRLVAREQLAALDRHRFAFASSETMPSTSE